MDTGHRSHKMTEQILNLTLEIIYLLTGEDYMVVKRSAECVTTSSEPHVSGGRSKSQSPIMVPPPQSLIHPGDNEQKILEIINKIIQMLSGEVPVRCQDVTVYLSMEEWEYLEGHKDQYKDVLMEDHRPLTPQDGSSNGCPGSGSRLLYSQEGPGESPHVSRDEKTDNLIVVKVEETEGDEECYKADLHYKEEEMPASISAGAPLSLDCRPLPSSSKANLNMAPNIHGQPFITISIPSIIHSGDLLPAPLIQPPSDQSRVPHLPPKPVRKKQKNDPQKDGGFPCAECGKSFETRQSFMEHLEVHTAEKPFVCTTCGKCFRHKSEIARHQNTHTGEKPFSCTECGKRFTAKTSLLAHQPIHTGEQPFPCPVCGKSFKWRRSFDRHQRIHKREKSEPCPQCGRCHPKLCAVDSP